MDKRGQVLMLVRRMKDAQRPPRRGRRAEPPRCRRYSGPGLTHFVRELAAMNLQVFITELDVNDRKLAESVPERDAGVAELIATISRLMLAEPNVAAALTWGITDRYTWLNGLPHASRPDGKPERPLPFDYGTSPTRPSSPSATLSTARPARSLPGADPYAPFNPIQAGRVGPRVGQARHHREELMNCSRIKS